jgi:hypothetical protein
MSKNTYELVYSDGNTKTRRRIVKSDLNPTDSKSTLRERRKVSSNICIPRTRIGSEKKWADKTDDEDDDGDVGDDDGNADELREKRRCGREMDGDDDADLSKS